MTLIQGLCKFLLSLMLFALLFTGCDNHKKESHSLAYDGGYLLLDSNIFNMVSVELSHVRTPRSYWQKGFEHVKALGANTIMVRIPWMMHEPRPGYYCFEEECDIRAFCELAADNGLLVWLHVGPYVDKYMDFGGIPWWLLKESSVEPRTLHPLFMRYVGRYFRALAGQLNDMQLKYGGPIALINIEEVFGSGRDVKKYLSALCDTLRAVGFDETQFTVSTTEKDILRVPNCAIPAVVVGEDNIAMSAFAGIKKLNHDYPVICSAVSAPIVRRWGDGFLPDNYNRKLMRTFELLNANGSLNIGFAIGATSFGHMAGAVVEDGSYKPYATSYGDGAIVDESMYRGKEAIRFTDLFMRKVIQPSGKKTIPEPNKVMNIPETVAVGYAPLFSYLSAPIESNHPMSFEECGFGYGGILYSVVIPKECRGAVLSIDGIHDYASIYVDNEFYTSLSRLEGTINLELPLLKEGTTIRILVDAMGRVADIKDRKGLVGNVKLRSSLGEEILLENWMNYPMPSDYSRIAMLDYTNDIDTHAPGYYRITFNTKDRYDSYLYMGSWGRGEVWINGRSLGRFHCDGPEKTLYLPGCWLKEGENEIIILDWAGPSKSSVEAYKNKVISR
ncbi:MAG: beta-galactosidase [Bacteroidaceae bacterium]|nr:beta-galactosidase [Bacteroidaceae bacterium]